MQKSFSRFFFPCEALNIFCFIIIYSPLQCKLLNKLLELLLSCFNVYAGPKPSELYGKFTWKIENFSQINKRELRSNAFEVGGYKW